MLSGQDLFNLQNRVAIVTGGSKGLGFEIAAALAGAGAEVLITSRNQQEIEAAAAAITRESGSRAVGLASDVTEPDKVQMMVDTALQRWGKVDILVNNADPFDDVPSEVADAIRRGRKMDAIKMYRSSSGRGLKESKEYVEEVQRRRGLDR